MLLRNVINTSLNAEMERMQKILEEDIFTIIHNLEIPWNEFKNRTVLVTGATGLIGKTLIQSLDRADHELELNMTVLAQVRNKEKFMELLPETVPEDRIVLQDIQQPIQYEGEVDYIIHCANITNSKLMVECPVETIQTTVIGTNNILQFALEKKVKGLVYLSSMEMYGITQEDPVREEHLGYLDLMNVRSSYPEGKRMAECMCVAFCKEYNVPVTIARLAQTFGAGISKNENRVFAQFARAIIEKKDIVLHTKGEKEQSFCYLSDAVSGILMLLLKGERGEAYNIVNPDTFISIKGMAELLVKVFPESGSKVVFDIPEDNIYGYAVSSSLNLCADKLRGLGWEPKYGLIEMFQRLIAFITEDEYEE